MEANYKNTFNTVSYKEQFLIKLASTKNVTFNVSCIKNTLLVVLERGNRNTATYITNILEPHIVPFRPFIGMTLFLCMIMVDRTLRE
jgi:hypothetical protein